MEKSEAQKSSSLQIGQVGVVVRDIDKAVEYYSSFGIGPFEPLNVSIIEREVYGKPAEDVKNIVKVAQVGKVDLELVQPAAGESIQKEFLERHGEGINHLGFFVDDLDQEVAKLVEKGFKVIMSAKFIGGGGFAYLDTDKVGGVQFELIQRPPH